MSGTGRGQRGRGDNEAEVEEGVSPPGPVCVVFWGAPTGKRGGTGGQGRDDQGEVPSTVRGILWGGEKRKSMRCNLVCDAPLRQL